jgi:hypothetical protein
MTDFRIWGTVTQIGPREFVVIVSAGSDPMGDGLVEQALATSRDTALAKQLELVGAMAVKVTQRGDRVIDVEYAE